MKVKKLIKLLKDENQEADVAAYIAAEYGWEIVELGIGDAILGRIKTGLSDTVLVPVEIPNRLEPWAGKTIYD